MTDPGCLVEAWHWATFIKQYCHEATEMATNFTRA